MQISIQQIKVSLAGKDILKNISLHINPGEQWALIGESGSGKTTLAKAIAKQVFYTGLITIHDVEIPSKDLIVEFVEQQHRFKNKSNTSQFYYQQRFNAADAEDTITVLEELKTFSSDVLKIYYWSKIFAIDRHLNKSLLLLSNGENKRLQLIKSLLKSPNLLILDNPFIGLDSSGRKDLANILNELTKKGIKLILIANEQDLPECITHVAVLQKGELNECRSPDRTEYQKISESEIKFKQRQLPRQEDKPAIQFEKAVKMVNVNITYNGKSILSNINWEVKKGEKWAISGPNGSGKSTLLSLINADNPQAYANEIYLFDKKRGTGESIWDIKKNIGFVSPELHLYFERNITCFQTIASGLFDTIGLFRKLNEKQTELVIKWMAYFDLEEEKNKTLGSLSLGKQRLVLLARAMIKTPALLILDEPYQGLDIGQIFKLKHVIDSICNNQEITLIFTSHYSEDLPICIHEYLKLDSGYIVGI